MPERVTADIFCDACAGKICYFIKLVIRADPADGVPVYKEGISYLDAVS